MEPSAIVLKVAMAALRRARYPLVQTVHALLLRREHVIPKGARLSASMEILAGVQNVVMVAHKLVLFPPDKIPDALLLNPRNATSTRVLENACVAWVMTV